MKLWIIYKDGFVISRIISEALQDYLENYVDVFVGKASKIDPILIAEDHLNYLIIGDIVNLSVPSLEIQNWTIKFNEMTETANTYPEFLSGFIISRKGRKYHSTWKKLITDNIKFKEFYPPILHLKMDNVNFTTESYINKKIETYSNKIINHILNLKIS